MLTYSKLQTALLILSVTVTVGALWGPGARGEGGGGKGHTVRRCLNYGAG